MENNTEIWRNIPCYDGVYKISNLGRVKSFKCKNEKILNCTIDSEGYVKAMLTNKNGKVSSLYIHQLVAESFLLTTKIRRLKLIKRLIVDHKDGIRSNNDKDNLRYVSYSFNLFNGFRKDRDFAYN
jgi:hypothetical protein